VIRVPCGGGSKRQASVVWRSPIRRRSHAEFGRRVRFDRHPAAPSQQHARSPPSAPSRADALNTGGSPRKATSRELF